MKKIYSFTHFANLLAILSGLGYYVVIEFFEIQSPYGIRPHPTQGLWQGFHIMVVPLLIFAFGLLWKDHIIKHLRMTKVRKKKSGLILLFSLILMTFSGYLIQVTSNPSLLAFFKGAHLYISLLWTGTFAYHYFKKEKLTPINGARPH